MSEKPKTEALEARKIKKAYAPKDEHREGIFYPLIPLDRWFKKIGMRPCEPKPCPGCGAKRAWRPTAFADVWGVEAISNCSCPNRTMVKMTPRTMEAKKFWGEVQRWSRDGGVIK